VLDDQLTASGEKIRQGHLAAGSIENVSVEVGYSCSTNSAKPSAILPQPRA
jgi:hypothetical protein